MLQETISYNRDRSNTVYVSLLDTKKVMTQGPIFGYFGNPTNKGCNLIIWEIIWRFYESFKCCVYMHGITSQWFPIGQGVHQGAPILM